MIVCDVPTFSRGEKGVFKIEDHIKPLLQILMENGSQILFVTHAESLFKDDIRKAIASISPSAKIISLQPSLDFESPGERVALKSFLIST